MRDETRSKHAHRSAKGADLNSEISTLPTYEELTALVVSLQERVTAIEAENRQLRTENLELRAQLARNSQNSSKPNTDHISAK